MEYSPIRVAFTESPNSSEIKVREVIKNDNLTGDSSNINKKYKNWYLTMSDFQKVILNLQQKKLAKKSRIENQKRIEQSIQKNLIHLSLQDIYLKMNSTLVSIINELTLLTPSLSESFIKKCIFIITKDDRMFYVGILFCIISFCLFVIQSTSK
jgi:hypothetical protein